MLKKLCTLAFFVFCLILSGGEKYSVLVFGDTHYDSMDVRTAPPVSDHHKTEMNRNLTAWKENMPFLIKTAAEKCNSTADFAVQLGDLTQGDCGSQELQEKSFRSVLSIFQSALKIPFYTVKGNHDIRGRGANAAYNAVMLPYMSKALNQPIPKNNAANFAVMHKGDLYIYFDCMKFDAKFVYDALKKHPDARYVFLLTHIPVLPGYNFAGISPKPKTHQNFRKVLAKHNVIVLSAHVHVTTFIRYKTDEGRIAQVINYSLPINRQRQPSVIEENIFELYKKVDRPNNLAAIKPLFEQYLEGFTYYKAVAGFNVLNVSDEGVFIDLYTGEMKAPFKTIKLR